MTQIETLYLQHYDDMLLTARRLLGNDEEARDAVSDVFAELLSIRWPLREDQAGSYLQVSVRNRCLNLLNHRRVMKATEQLLPIDTKETTDYVEPPLEQVLDYIDTNLTAKTIHVVKQCLLANRPDLMEQLMKVKKKCYTPNVVIPILQKLGLIEVTVVSETQVTSP